MIPYGRQDIDDADIAAVVDVLKSDWLTQGPAVPAFEAAVAKYCGAAHGVAVNSATSALHVAYLALGLAPGKRLWTVPNTFLATANAARLCGADVDFVDIDPLTYNISVPALEAKLLEASHHGRLPDVVAPVHFAGQPCDMAPIRALGDRYGFAIVEDASHAVGAEYDSQRIGAGRPGDCAVFSFHPVKLITTGEGGMIVTQRLELAEKMRRLRGHGMTRDPALMTHASEGDWYYQQIDLGLNYRLTDIHAVLGLSQIKRLDSFLVRRRELAARYTRLFADTGFVTPTVLPNCESAWHLYVIQVPLASQRKFVFDALRAADIGVNVHYIPVHLQPYYRALGFSAGDYPQSEAYYSRAISLPMYPGLTDAQQDYIVAQCLEALRGAPDV
jgi:UDP-4-amino-4,6-dideoxy-N-acetyl-beta-L-altrosamine transaminase